jgi:hypothetical protein
VQFAIDIVFHQRQVVLGQQAHQRLLSASGMT